MNMTSGLNVNIIARLMTFSYDILQCMMKKMFFKNSLKFKGRNIVKSDLRSL